jgi:hypothetical protein
MASLINAEIRNHPERLIKMSGQMLEGEQFTLPSGYAVRQQETVRNFIPIDLKYGRRGRDRVFEDVTSTDSGKITNRKDLWLEEGITYPGSSTPRDQYKFSPQVHNMNDIPVVHFFKASNSGNKDIDDWSNVGIMLLYAGREKYSKMYSSKIDVRGSNFLSGMTKLRKRVETQQRLGNHYMCVLTRATKGVIIGENDHSCHAANIDINALLAIDLNNMETGRAYPSVTAIEAGRTCHATFLAWQSEKLAVHHQPMNLEH